MVTGLDNPKTNKKFPICLTELRKLKWHFFCELALVGIIPNQILFSFSSDKDRRTDSRFRQKKQRSPAGAALFCFSSDPAISSSIFVRAEREENVAFFGFFFGSLPICNGNLVGVRGQRGDRKIQGRQKMCRDRGSNPGLRNQYPAPLDHRSSNPPVRATELLTCFSVPLTPFAYCTTACKMLPRADFDRRHFQDDHENPKRKAYSEL